MPNLRTSQPGRADVLPVLRFATAGDQRGHVQRAATATRPLAQPCSACRHRRHRPAGRPGCGRGPGRLVRPERNGHCLAHARRGRHQPWRNDHATRHSAEFPEQHRAHRHAIREWQSPADRGPADRGPCHGHANGDRLVTASHRHANRCTAHADAGATDWFQLRRPGTVCRRPWPLESSQRNRWNPCQV